MREPRVTKVKCLLGFDLANGFKAALMGDIESAGPIQYHYLLVVFSPDTAPCLYVGSEWSSLDPSYKDAPVLGVFTSDSHLNLGNSVSWRDVNLFLLRAVEIAREQMQIGDGSLTVGETWALTQIMKWFNQHPDGRGAADSRYPAYRDALSRNDQRLAQSMKSTWDDLSRDEGRMQAVVERIETIKKEIDEIRRHG